jgi:hypothetical protein
MEVRIIQLQQLKLTMGYDVTFKEDDYRIRRGFVAENMSIMGYS